MKSIALIVVDVQNDFCPGGSYPVPDGDVIIQPINTLIAYARIHDWLIVYSRDWHPIDMPGSQHCIKETDGAKFYPQLAINTSDVVISKGMDVGPKHYSAFNGDDIQLEPLLKQHNVKTVFIVGLAYDYCVKKTALDAQNYGYKTYIIEDATKGIFKKTTIDDLRKELMDAKITIVNSNEVYAQLL